MKLLNIEDMNTWNFLGAMILCASVAAGCGGGGG